MSRAEVLLHPARLRIVQVVAALGEATTASLVKNLPDVPAPSLYRHLRQLVDAELLEVASERQVRGAKEKTYRLPAHGNNLGPDEVASASKDDVLRWFMTWLMGLYGDMELYLARGEHDLGEDGVGFHTSPLWLSDDELGAFAAEVNAAVVARLANKPSPERKLRSFSTCLLPGDVVADAASD